MSRLYVCKTTDIVAWRQPCIVNSLCSQPPLCCVQAKRNTGYDKSAVEVDPSQPAFTRRREVRVFLCYTRVIADASFSVAGNCNTTAMHVLVCR